MPRPELVIVSGPAGTGKTTLAQTLASTIGCPAISRDQIKEGIACTTGPFEPSPGDPLTLKTLHVFFEILRTLLANHVTLVAEAAFQHNVWLSNLEPLTAGADLRIIDCHTTPEVATTRIAGRTRTAHADQQLLTAFREGDSYFDSFERISLPVPTIRVDTTSGYEPDLDELIDFIGCQSRTTVRLTDGRLTRASDASVGSSASSTATRPLGAHRASRIPPFVDRKRP